MENGENPLAFLPRLIAGYYCGWYTQAEVAGYCLVVADERTAAGVVAALPPELRDHLAERVRQAPATEFQWEGVELVDFGVVGGEGEPGPKPEGQVVRFRAAVESLRRLLEKGE